VAGGEDGRTSEVLESALESELEQLRSRRASTRVRRLAFLAVAWLIAGFALGVFVATRIGFVPNEAKTITYLMFAALVFSAWWQWYSSRTSSNASDPVTEMSFALTSVCVAALVAATLWIAADISSGSMHFALAVDIGAGSWFATTVVMMTPGHSVQDAIWEFTTIRIRRLVLTLLISIFLLVVVMYAVLVFGTAESAELTNPVDAFFGR
jgi:hypothetical protein